ncbi:MAG: hypothetical protein LBV54_04475, partial [Puniceicoccales bacterium]|nr:hypothetical protein [Puniceicoccales bacterium]
MHRASSLFLYIVFICAAVFALPVSGAIAAASESLTLTNAAGVTFQVQKADAGWTLGTISFHGKPVENPLDRGVLILRSAKGKTIRFIPADTAKRIDELTIELAGKTDVDGVALTFQVRLALDKDAPVVRITPSWKVAKDLPGWEVGFTYQSNNFSGNWRAQHYPFAGNSEKLWVTPLRYCGVPGVLLYKTDLSTIALFAIDSRSDYLNPRTWTGKT